MEMLCAGAHSARICRIPLESAEMTVGLHMVYKMVWKKGGSTNEILRKTQ